MISHYFIDHSFTRVRVRDSEKTLTYPIHRVTVCLSQKSHERGGCLRVVVHSSSNIDIFLFKTDILLKNCIPNS